MAPEVGCDIPVVLLRIRVGQWIDAYDAVALVPWVLPPVQPFFDAHREAVPGRRPVGVLCARMLFLTDDHVRWGGAKSWFSKRADKERDSTHQGPGSSLARAVIQKQSES